MFIRQLFYLSLFVTILLVGAINIPKSVAQYHEAKAALFGLGVIGIWRYSWWMNHVVRSIIYRRLVYPRRQARAAALWQQGWRPQRLYFMMTTYNELPATTNIVLASIVSECIQVGVPVKLFIGLGSEFDEQVIQAFFAQQALTLPIEVITVRQQRPGKRYAIGDTLRAIIRSGLDENDPVIFMDGDTYFEPGCLQKCLPFFPLFPRMQALTTYENAIVHNGPMWVSKWLEMRFAQRDLTMQSYSLSNKILTLTGRMSIFRGKHLLEPAFTEIVENDKLTHWLWGEYRFLSGDDKSTWYYLLKQRADMFYIPDATTITIEYIHGSALDRMKENLRRWSGNTLRNGARAIALGPRTVGWFTWWCLIDQRLSMWTMLLGHMITLTLTVTKAGAFFFVSMLWIALSRLCTSMVLFIHARRIDMSYPFLVYTNQLMTAVIKIYILFRLPQQRWSNRGAQHAGFDADSRLTLRRWVATYLTSFYCLCCLLIILLYLGLVRLPTLADIRCF